MNEYSLQTDFARDDRYAHKILNRDEMDYYNKFNRFGILDPYAELGRTREYIFFTKPDLQLLQNSGKLNPELANDPFFMDAERRFPNVVRQLQMSFNNNRNPYMNLLTNCVGSSLDLPSISAGEVETAANIHGDTISYRWSSGSSDVDHEFSLEFGDSKYLEVYMLFKIWDEYCSKKARGGITVPDHYVLNKILHDQVAVYKIIVDEDGETIIFFAKLTGVYPKSVPREAFSSLNEDGGLKLSVNFKAAFVEDMDPLIIAEFNHIANTYRPNGSVKPIYIPHKGVVNNEWVNMPFIVGADICFGPGPRYKLKWR